MRAARQNDEGPAKRIAMRNGTFGAMTAMLALIAFLAGVVRATLAWEQTTQAQRTTVSSQAHKSLKLAA
jgi:hypothetical protein